MREPERHRARPGKRRLARLRITSRCLSQEGGRAAVRGRGDRALRAGLPGRTGAGRAAGRSVPAARTRPGTGKTKTVEALAEVLHGSEKNLLKIDCGEFQMEHEVAKLIGAPPGYLGHRETQPMLTQQKLSMVGQRAGPASPWCSSTRSRRPRPRSTRLLLGILDKAVLRLGDNTTVNFERQPDLPDQQPGQPQHDEGDPAGLRLRGRRWPRAAGRRQEAGEHRRSARRARGSLPSSSIASTGSSPTVRWMNSRSPRSWTSTSRNSSATSARACGPGGFDIEVPPETRRALLRRGPASSLAPGSSSARCTAISPSRWRRWWSAAASSPARRCVCCSIKRRTGSFCRPTRASSRG